MIPAIKAIADRHIEDKVPIIIEGDFIYPEFTLSFENPEVKSLFVNEPDKEQLLQNFYAREGGNLQYFRADISIAYGQWIKNISLNKRMNCIESRPWDTLLNRVLEHL